MLDLLKTLSDDQTALLGCGVAFLGATCMLMMSFHANPKNKQRSESQTDPESSVEAETSDQERRRAA